MSKAAFYSLFLAILVAALGFRTSRLDLRPMHHDEANQAVKFGSLLERGEYHYDPSDHHGPTLYYLTLPLAWVRGQKTLADLDEGTLRLLPALFGAGMILLLLPLAGSIGRTGALWAGLLVALSPAMTYFSRFYIQEALFAFFALGFMIACGRYALSRTTAWALAAGIFAGLAYATKETAVIIFAATAGALGLAMISTRKPGGHSIEASAPAGASRSEIGSRPIRAHQLALGLSAAAIVGVVFYSSFFASSAGILDSIRALRDYALRATEEGPHAHPWYYYASLLAYSSSGRMIWSEGMVLALALIGSVSAFRKAPASADTAHSEGAAGGSAGNGFWLRYLVMYSWFVAIALSALRLKTPWNLLPMYSGLILVAGSGAAILVKSGRSVLIRRLVAVLILAGNCHLAVQNWRANFAFPADQRNPYVYAQTSPDLLRLVKRVHDLAGVHPDGKDMLIKIIADPYEQWPLPWYLRDLRRAGYWTRAGSAGSFSGVSVAVASQENVPALEALLGDRFQAEIYGLRPEVFLTMYIDRPLWDRFLKRTPGR